MFVNNINAILLITFCLIIFQIKYIKKFNLEINKLKNNEKFTADDEQIKQTVLNTVDQVYNMDTEAIRNLGAISKSILTGKNYHNLSGTAIPGKLIIPADVGIQGKFDLLPEGCILIWAKSEHEIPNGWVRCDGSDPRAPNLSGRFILGYGDAAANNDNTIGHNDDTTNAGYPSSYFYEPYMKGGVQKHELSVDEMPKHDHWHQHFAVKNASKNWYPQIKKIGPVVTGRFNGGYHDYGFTHTENANDQADVGPTSHGGTPQGKNYKHNNMPPFRVLCYIMKVY